MRLHANTWVPWAPHAAHDPCLPVPGVADRVLARNTGVSAIFPSTVNRDRG